MMMMVLEDERNVMRRGYVCSREREGMHGLGSRMGSFYILSSSSKPNLLYDSTQTSRSVRHVIHFIGTYLLKLKNEWKWTYVEY